MSPEVAPYRLPTRLLAVLSLCCLAGGCNGGDGGGGPPPLGPPGPPPGGCMPPAATGCAIDIGSSFPFEMTGTTNGEVDSFGGASCAMGGDRARDVAFRWTAVSAGRYRFSTRGSGFDTMLVLRDGSCTGPELGCNDDIRRGTVQSELELDLGDCQTVTVVVDGFDSGSVGDFRLSIGGIESACGDGVDNDLDGAADCDDLDCFTSGCAPDDGWPVEWAQLEQEMLVEVNRYRAMGVSCAADPYPPAPPLEMDETIRVAARAHSLDMGEQGYFEHDSLDGREFSDRMADAGFMGPFPWAENIANGYATAEDATRGLIESPGHCRNIMDPEHRVVGIGYAFVEGSPAGSYWTQDFAAGH